MTDLQAAFWRGFHEELQKIAVSKNMAAFLKSRAGRRPISVANMLKKAEFDVPYPDLPLAQRKPLKRGEVPSREDQSLPKNEDGRGFTNVLPLPSQTYTDVAAAQSPERSF